MSLKVINFFSQILGVLAQDVISNQKQGWKINHLITQSVNQTEGGDEFVGHSQPWLIHVQVTWFFRFLPRTSNHRDEKTRSVPKFSTQTFFLVSKKVNFLWSILAVGKSFGKKPHVFLQQHLCLSFGLGQKYLLLDEFIMFLKN